MCVCIYIFFSLSLYGPRGGAGTPAEEAALYQKQVPVGLYTTLLLLVLYGVWHTKGRFEGGRVLPNSRAMVLQQCGQCKRAGRMQGRLIRAQTTRSKRRPCKGQGAGPKRASTVLPPNLNPRFVSVTNGCEIVTDKRNCREVS